MIDALCVWEILLCGLLSQGFVSRPTKGSAIAGFLGYQYKVVVGTAVAGEKVLVVSALDGCF